MISRLLGRIIFWLFPEISDVFDEDDADVIG